MTDDGHDRSAPACEQLATLIAPHGWEPPRQLLAQAIDARAFPCAVVEVGSTRGPIWREAFGSLTPTLEGQSLPPDPAVTPATPETIFDLASLTKVLATTTLAMRLVDAGALDLEQRVAEWLPAWRGTWRGEHVLDVTLADLLAHASGLPAHLHLYDGHTGRTEFEAAICATPLEYAPRTQAIYSDLGIMLLGFILEDAARATLSVQFGAIAGLVHPHRLAFTPPRAWRAQTAPTEIEQWRGRVLVGEVHDLNAWALGGVAGHAGLFGSAPAVGAFARLMLAALRDADDRLARHDTVRAFARRTAVPGSTRALGWDTMKSTSSCGTRMSASAIGHTGFTGTSLWIDWERDLYVVLLTNRVHPNPSNDAILRVRPALHDAVVEAWMSTGGIGPGAAPE
jgi:serine-type D-Ala-D-Ala carboxypeptidase